MRQRHVTFDFAAHLLNQLLVFLGHRFRLFFRIFKESSRLVYRLLTLLQETSQTVSKFVIQLHDWMVWHRGQMLSQSVEFGAIGRLLRKTANAQPYNVMLPKLLHRAFFIGQTLNSKGSLRKITRLFLLKLDRIELLDKIHTTGLR